MEKEKTRSTTKTKSLHKITTKSVAIAKGAVKTSRTAFRSDAKQTATLIKVGRTGAANAIRASKALGLPITYMQKGVLYREQADGTKEVIATTPAKKGDIKKSANPLKKGMVLHAKK